MEKSSKDYGKVVSTRLDQDQVKLIEMIASNMSEKDMSISEYLRIAAVNYAEILAKNEVIADSMEGSSNEQNPVQELIDKIESSNKTVMNSIVSLSESLNKRMDTIEELVYMLCYVVLRDGESDSSSDAEALKSKAKGKLLKLDQQKSNIRSFCKSSDILDS